MPHKNAVSYQILLPAMPQIMEVEFFSKNPNFGKPKLIISDNDDADIPLCKQSNENDHFVTSLQQLTKSAYLTLISSFSYQKKDLQNVQYFSSTG